MPFPRYHRVIYQKPVLEEVISQVRFPDILRIGTEEPASFQEAIRREFPVYSVQKPSLPENMPPQAADVIRQLSGQQGFRNAYDFASENGQWKVGLATNFLALSTTAYGRWEQFSGTLAQQIELLQKIYQPAYFHRLGLRYRDVIIRSKLGLDDVPWSELLQPYICGELGADELSDNVLDKSTTTVVNLGQDVGRVQINHFLASMQETNEKCYVVDADFFYENKVGAENAIEHLDTLNRYAGRFFRWCLTDKLYEAMDPRNLE